MQLKENIKERFPILLQYYRKAKLQYRRMAILPELRRWDSKAKPDPADPEIKYTTVRKYGKLYDIETFVETGTYIGDLVASVEASFKKIYSVELSKEIWEMASRRFKENRKIQILQGDSSKILPSILSQLEQPTLFWLDAHYSDGITARGELETPIEVELDHIFAHPIKNHVILIDDARLFVKNPWYPTLQKIKDMVAKQRPHYTFEIRDDIIRIAPPA